MNDPAPLTRVDLLHFLARPRNGSSCIEQGLDGRAAAYVHVGGCHMAGKRSKGITQDQARRALNEGVDDCPQCRPDAELGVLEG
ncbi:DUF6233 domain-containing protein [Streptomyces sp. NBC_01283]|uniref:DUF6233 domain-containing protein n=1 Tax=Streptomyces sp. NBC_01283 TaxID=2903812 RepID=UPI00352D56C8|nr:DUF6233 domain-containing protein [Streptomyces sp. NBC_01283]